MYGTHCYCGGPRTNPNNRYCAICRASANERTLDRRRHQAAGFCHCGREREDPAFAWCAACREKALARYHARNARKRAVHAA